MLVVHDIKKFRLAFGDPHDSNCFISIYSLFLGERKVLDDEEEGKLSDQNGNSGDYKLSPAAVGAASSFCNVACKARSGTIPYST